MKYEREFTIRANDVVRFQQGLMLRGSGLRIVGIAIMGVVIAWLYVQWLNIEATAKGYNFSAVLQEALRERLGISDVI